MTRKFSKKDKAKQRKIFVDALFDARTDPKKFGCFKMKKSVYGKLLEGIREGKQRQKELRDKVEAEAQNYLETVILPKFNIKKKWHIHLHTRGK